jgi:Mg-chelatase subunit ChlD
MQWRTKRKLAYGSLGLFILAVIITVPTYFVFFTNQPTCFDGLQNGLERGVDCSGACNLVCEIDAKSLKITSSGTFRVQTGIYNSVAIIENPNIDFGATGITYVLSAVDALGREYDKRQGIIDFMPGAIVPIFEPSLRVPFNVEIVDTKIVLGDVIWEKNVGQEKKLSVTTGFIENEDVTPTLSGSIRNQEAVSVGGQQIVALVSDDEGHPVGVSSTIVESLQKGESKEIFFTWPEPFYLGSRICDAQSGKRLSSFLGDVAIVIDRSGSMDDEGGDPAEPLHTVKLAAIRFAKSLGSSDLGSIVSFANEATIDSGLIQNTRTLTSVVDKVSIFDDKIQNTNLGDGLAKSLDILNNSNSGNERKAVVLLTDGVATRPKIANNPDYPQEYALGFADELKENEIEIYVIGLGSDVDEEFLQTIASSPQNYYGVDEKESLNRIYDSIASEICSKKPAIVKTYVVPND